MEKLKLGERERGPIKRYDQYLVEYEVLTPEEIAGSHARARKEAEEARDKALKCPFPDPARVADGVFAE